MIKTKERIGKIQTAAIGVQRLTGAVSSQLHQASDMAVRDGSGALVLDLSDVGHITQSGVAALVEFYSDIQNRIALAFHSPAKDVKAQISNFAIGRILPIHASLEDTLASMKIGGLRLSGTRAVLLCAGKGTRMAPLTDCTPKPMLDILGKPILEHIMSHLGSFGIRDFYLNPGHLGDQIVDYCRDTGDRSIFFAREGIPTDSGWQGAGIGSGSTLSRLATYHSAFQDDVIVLCGDALIDVDLYEMMALHRTSGAAVTIAAQNVPVDKVSNYGILDVDDTNRIHGFQEKPAPADAASTLASTGIYIFSADALDGFGTEEGLDIAQHILPAILQRGGKLQAFAKPFNWWDVGRRGDYAQVIDDALKGEIKGLVPHGTRNGDGAWISPEARLARGVRIDGACYIGPGAVIHPGAVIQGPSMIGAGAVIEAGAHVSNSIVLPGTSIQGSERIESAFVSNDWIIPKSPAADDVVAVRRGKAEAATQVTQSATLLRKTG